MKSLMENNLLEIQGSGKINLASNSSHSKNSNTKLSSLEARRAVEELLLEREYQSMHDEIDES